MLFNSIDFAIFLPLVFLIYWFLANKNIRTQNVFLLAASYVFYGWWDWRFLSLIIISSCTDYCVGLGFSKTNQRLQRIILLWISITVNLGLLGFFKYYNFFIENFVHAFSFLGHSISPHRLDLILPVGISFYTFQTLSYTIDLYRRKIEPTRDIIAFFSFVGFFPQLVAGPIERASHLLPQFFQKRVFNHEQAVDGMRQMLWGLFKKIVIADNCATYVNMIFENSDQFSGSTLLIGAVLFSFQIYGDFSGYSDIAIGTARLFGFNLRQNFAYPYFSRDIAEFWRRWHISLSSWFKDYLYIPLGGSRCGTWVIVRNVLLVFVVCGFWHGANWTFIAWGALNAVYYLPILFLKRARRNIETVAPGKFLPNYREFCQIILTFSLTTLAWIFFRAESVSHAGIYISRIFTGSLFARPHKSMSDGYVLAIFICVMIVVEWVQREKKHALELSGRRMPLIIRWGIYYGTAFVIFWFKGSPQEFIYFQF